MISYNGVEPDRYYWVKHIHSRYKVEVWDICILDNMYRKWYRVHGARYLSDKKIVEIGPMIESPEDKE